MAHIAMAHFAMADIAMAYTAMAYTAMAYIAMAHLVMADIVMAVNLQTNKQIVMADMVMVPATVDDVEDGVIEEALQKKSEVYITDKCVEDGTILLNGMCKQCPPGAQCPSAFFNDFFFLANADGERGEAGSNRRAITNMP